MVNCVSAVKKNFFSPIALTFKVHVYIIASRKHIQNQSRSFKYMPMQYPDFKTHPCVFIDRNVTLSLY